MGFIAPRTPEERARHGHSGTTYNEGGDVLLRATNLYNNWHFNKLNLDGDPEGLSIGMPEDAEGIFLYVSEMDAGPETLAAQNTVPFSLDESTITAREPHVPGHTPRTLENSADIAQPPTPRLSAIPASKMGFEAGPHYISYAWVGITTNKRGKPRLTMTPAAPFSLVTIQSRGQFIRAELPQNPSEGAIGLAILLTKTDTLGLGFAWSATATVQEVLDIRYNLPLFHILKGPYGLSNGKPPAQNETRPRNPRGPKGKKVRGYRPGRHGRFRIRSSFVGPSGLESDPSEYSDVIEITPEEAEQNTWIEVDWGDESSDPDTRYIIYVEREELDGSSIEEFVFESARSGSAVSQEDDAPQFSGRTDEENAPGESSALSRKSKKKNKTKKDASGKASSTVSSTDEGLQIPTDPMVATPIGDALLETKSTGITKYWVALSYWVRGEETVPCKAQQISLNPGETIRVFPQDPVNLLTNSQFADLDSDGKPDGWTLTGVAGNPNEGAFEVTPDGVGRMYSLGKKTVPGNPLHRTPGLSNAFSVNRNELYTVGGTFATSNHLFGQVQVFLEEYAVDPRTTPGAVVVRPATLLKSTSSSGEVDYLAKFGAGATALSFHDSTVYAQVVIRYNGPERQADVAISEMFAFMHPSRIRRGSEPADSRDPSNPDPLALVSWPRGSFKMVGPPPVKRRTTPVLAPIDKFSFGDTGAIQPATAGWTPRLTGGTSGQVLTTSAIDGAYGYNTLKNTAASGLTYIHKTFTPSTRGQLALRAKFRIRQMPTAGHVILMQIKDSQADSVTAGNTLAYVQLNPDGILYAVGMHFNGIPTSTPIASGVRSGDVLDIELIVSGGGTVNGFVIGGAGKNGTRRTFANPIGPYLWPAQYAKCAQIGVSYAYYPSATWDMDIDTIAVTERGDTLVDAVISPALEPVPLPDRPLRGPVVLQNLGFDGGVLPPELTTSRSPVDGTTFIGVLGGSAVDGTHGLRVSDSGTAVASDIRATHTFSADRESVGYRTRFRVVGRPTTGSTYVMSVVSNLGTWLAYAYLDSAGNLFVAGQSTVGTSPAPVLVASGITNGQVVTLELVLSGAGGSSGLLSAWCEVGGTGSAASRKLMAQPIPLNWSGHLVRSAVLGLVETSALTTASYDFDSVFITEFGEVLFREYTNSGDLIFQAYAYYVDGTPIRDDLWMRNWRKAVKPGQTYRASLYARYARLLDTCYPCTITAYDRAGNPVPWPADGGGNGCLYGEAGAVGTMGWTLVERIYVIPDGCYEVRMESLDISSGEFVAQELVFSDGTVAITEVTYPAEGEVWIVLDTGLSETAPEPISNASFMVNRWLSSGIVVEAPEGTSVEIEYGSSPGLVEPNIWYPTKEEVQESRYAHYKVTMFSDVTLTKTPVLRSGFPFIEYATYLDGHVHVPKLLRGDGTEFPGGAYVMGLKFPRKLGDYELTNVKGRTQAHLRSDPVMKLGGCTIRILSEDAYVEIEENCLDPNTYFMVEGHGRRLRSKFIEQLEFDFVDENGNVLAPEEGENDGKFFSRMDASVTGLDVYEVAPMTRRERAA